MIGPSSEISKLLLVLLLFLLAWYVYMDVNLYFRIHNYPIDDEITDNSTITYSQVAWINCKISPMCDITPKALLLDQTNHYLFGPLVKIVDKLFKVSDTQWITPNLISFFHVFVAVVSAKCFSSDSLAYRRIGVVLFEFRTFLDDMDGHVARERKNIKGEISEVGTSGYYIDGICDGLGTIALLVGVFLFLKNNPPRRGYMQLPTIINDSETTVYRVKVTTKKVVLNVVCFAAQLLLSSMGWNRYIAIYQDMLGKESGDWLRRCVILKSSFFFIVVMVWRIVNVHNLMHFLLLSVFCDKLWEFLRFMQYIGFVIVLGAICVAEIHIMDVKNFLYHDLSNATMY
ncbi:ceramide phosphoethanolamine synthase [Onthophagus taurus]|uniref:ceramide phosphoethanolamine synthase n=1 Tax=Onthophagus taurus TaxID=166361 RepID=UPI000C20CD88|nr:ceramide phosphoethanolamine synthase [Onthophagus taurus]XP_022905150.1 ceramide phosphoethanolamine synthase [Onthophagus taurus]